MSAPHYQDDHVTLYHGDCLEVMASLPAESVHAIVTDPPYGLGFMGREWDGLPPGREWAEACLRVLKPGGHMLAFGGSRTWHRLAVAVEDAGFEIRDSIAWLYGSGFPKSLNVATAIDRFRSAEPVHLLSDEDAFCQWMRKHSGLTTADARRLFGSDRFITGEVQIVNAATVSNPRMVRRAMVPTYAAWQKARPALAVDPPEWVESLVKSPPQPGVNTPGEEWKPGRGKGAVGDNEWAGWGTALKPAFEPIVVARKPLAGTVAANVLAHGTGALNVDGCRVGSASGLQRPERRGKGGTGGWAAYVQEPGQYGTPDGAGRWPTNVVLDDTQAAELDKQSGESRSPAPYMQGTKAKGDVYGLGSLDDKTGKVSTHHGDSGGASRFFPTFRYEAKAPTEERPRVNGVAHPTVKPLDLMRWLVRLVTPPGGTILDPFAGSGTTAEACVIEGFQHIAIEREADYLPLIKARLAKPLEPVLDLGALS